MPTTHHFRNNHGQRFQVRRSRNADDLYFPAAANANNESKSSLESIAKSSIAGEKRSKSGAGGRRGGLMSRGLKVLGIERRSDRDGIRRERNKLRKRER
jgi:hypothetical protein